eukprot:2604531-Prymnesium_polylepis.1
MGGSSGRRRRAVRGEELAGRDPSARSLAEFPHRTSATDLLERVRVGQTKRDRVNSAEHAPPSKSRLEGVVLRHMGYNPDLNCGPRRTHASKGTVQK